MASVDPEQAARDLAEVDQRLRRGAELMAPRWWQAVWCLFVVVQGASWDIPAPRWRGAVMLMLGSAMLVSVVLMHTRARARPLSIPTGWWTWLLIWAVAITSYAAMMGGGHVLRTLAVPLPFTLSSLLMVLALSLLFWSGRRWRGSYVQRIRQGQW